MTSFPEEKKHVKAPSSTSSSSADLSADEAGFLRMLSEAEQQCVHSVHPRLARIGEDATKLITYYDRNGGDPFIEGFFEFAKDLPRSSGADGGKHIMLFNNKFFPDSFREYIAKIYRENLDIRFVGDKERMLEERRKHLEKCLQSSEFTLLTDYFGVKTKEFFSIWHQGLFETMTGPGQIRAFLNHKIYQLHAKLISISAEKRQRYLENAIASPEFAFLMDAVDKEQGLGLLYKWCGYDKNEPKTIPDIPPGCLEEVEIIARCFQGMRVAFIERDLAGNPIIRTVSYDLTTTLTETLKPTHAYLLGKKVAFFIEYRLVDGGMIIAGLRTNHKDFARHYVTYFCLDRLEQLRKVVPSAVLADEHAMLCALYAEIISDDSFVPDSSSDSLFENIREEQSELIDRALISYYLLLKVRKMQHAFSALKVDFAHQEELDYDLFILQSLENDLQCACDPILRGPGTEQIPDVSYLAAINADLPGRIAHWERRGHKVILPKQITKHKKPEDKKLADINTASSALPNRLVPSAAVGSFPSASSSNPKGDKKHTVPSDQPLISSSSSVPPAAVGSFPSASSSSREDKKHLAPSRNPAALASSSSSATAVSSPVRPQFSEKEMPELNKLATAVSIASVNLISCSVVAEEEILKMRPEGGTILPEIKDEKDCLVRLMKQCEQLKRKLKTSQEKVISYKVTDTLPRKVTLRSNPALLSAGPSGPHGFIATLKQETIEQINDIRKYDQLINEYRARAGKNYSFDHVISVVHQKFVHLHELMSTLTLYFNRRLQDEHSQQLTILIQAVRMETDRMMRLMPLLPKFDSKHEVVIAINEMVEQIQSSRMFFNIDYAPRLGAEPIIIDAIHLNRASRADFIIEQYLQIKQKDTLQERIIVPPDKALRLNIIPKIAEQRKIICAEMQKCRHAFDASRIRWNGGIIAHMQSLHDHRAPLEIKGGITKDQVKIAGKWITPGLYYSAFNIPGDHLLNPQVLDLLKAQKDKVYHPGIRKHYLAVTSKSLMNLAMYVRALKACRDHISKEPTRSTIDEMFPSIDRPTSSLDIVMIDREIAALRRAAKRIMGSLNVDFSSQSQNSCEQAELQRLIDNPAVRELILEPTVREQINTQIQLVKATAAQSETFQAAVATAEQVLKTIEHENRGDIMILGAIDLARAKIKQPDIAFPRSVPTLSASKLLTSPSSFRHMGSAAVSPGPAGASVHAGQPVSSSLTEPTRSGGR